MKKLVTICLSLVLLVSLSMTAAAAGAFVSSPSANSAPIIEDFIPSDEDCTAELRITAYADRSELSEYLLALFEKAYNQIVNTKDLTTLNPLLADYATAKGFPVNSLAVSDLFDIHMYGCDDEYHHEHKEFDIVLKADTLHNFVALLHLREDGNWELLTDAVVSEDGEYLHFSVDDFSPFAVVIGMNEDTPPQTGDLAVYLWAMIAATSAVLLVVVNAKKKNA